MSLLKWDDLIPEAQIFMLKKQYAAQGKYSLKTFKNNICASKSVGGFDWHTKDCYIILDIIFGKFRTIYKVSMHLYLYKYIIK